MSETSDFGRRLKYLRERDQITPTKLSQLCHLEKERIRDLEAGRSEPKDWEIDALAEALKVKPEYFQGKAAAGASAAALADAADAPPEKRGAPRGKGGPSLDFTDFSYFKQPGGKAGPPSRAEARDAEPEPERELPPDMFGDSSSIVVPVKPPDAAPPAPPPNAADARFAATEALVYVKALVEVLENRGLFTAEDFAKALRRARGG